VSKYKEMKKKSNESKLKSNASQTNQNQKPIIGTCQSMCPANERMERLRFNTLATVETEHSERPGWTLEQLMVKKFRRSAAGSSKVQPSEVRSTSILCDTLRYLCSHVIDLDRIQHDDPRWRDDTRKSHSRPIFAGDLELFLRDRLRMVAKDLALQGFSADGQSSDANAIYCMEAIVRFHIIAAHDCCEADITDFDPHMNWSSLSGYVSSLDHLYKLARKQQSVAVANVWCANEPVMRSYMLLAMLPPPLHLWMSTPQQNQKDEIAAKRIQTMLTDAMNNHHCLSHPLFLNAICACQSVLSKDYATFFNIVRDCKDIVFLCGLHSQFAYMRVRALQSINYAYRSFFTLKSLADLLCCDDETQAQSICSAVGLDVQPSSTGILRVVLDHKKKIPTVKQSDRQLGCLLSKKSTAVACLYEYQTRGSIVLATSNPFKVSNDFSDATKSNNKSDCKIGNPPLPASHASLIPSKQPTLTESKHQVKNKTSPKKKNEIVVDSINELRSKIIIEIRKISDPNGHAFAIKDDLTKCRSKNKVAKVFIHRLNKKDASSYVSSNNKQNSIAVEKKISNLYTEAFKSREHRLASSVLKESSIKNAAVAILCQRSKIGQICQSFRTRETESVIGLIPVPFACATSKEKQRHGDEDTATTTNVTATFSLGKQQVMEAWKRQPLTSKEDKVEIKLGHHLLRMFHPLSTAIRRLQQSGKLTIPVKNLFLVLIVQRSGGSKSVRIDCLGGKRHFGEFAHECAIREVNEEVGYQMLTPVSQQFLCSFPLDENMESFVAVV
jgi:hypothetical protein